MEASNTTASASSRFSPRPRLAATAAAPTDPTASVQSCQLATDCRASLSSALSEIRHTMEATNATSPHVIKALAEAAFHVYDTRNPLFQPAEGQKLLDLLPEGDKTLSDTKIRMQVHRMRTADGGTPTFVAAIRGSDNLENWLVNLQATLVPADKRLIGEPATGSGPTTPMVHSAWQMIAIQLCNVLEEVLSKHTQDVQGGSSHLYCVGHSLGGALSVLLALVRSQRAPTSKVHVFTWGAPMAGNDAFNELCQGTLTSDEGETRAVQFVNDLDVVPRVPSEALGFSPWLEAQVKIDTPESRSLLGPLAAAPGAIKMLLSGRKAAAVAKVLNCTKDQLKHMHSCHLYFDLTLCQLGERPATQMVQSSEQDGIANMANAIRAGGLVYELGGHESEFMPRQQVEAVEAAAGLLTHGTTAAEWVAKASLAAGAANLAVTLIGQGVAVRSLWRLEEAATGMRVQLSEQHEQLERMEAGVIEKIDGSFKHVEQQLKGINQQLSKLDELVRDIPSQLRDARIDGCMEELRAAVKLLDDRDEQVWRQASVDSTKLFTRICTHLDDRREQIEAETENSSRHLLPFERYYKELLHLHLRATNRLAKIAGPHASSYSTEVIQAARNQLSGTQRNTHEALLANAGFLLWHASSSGPDGATVGANASSRSPHQRPALYGSLLGTVENLLPDSEGPSQGPSDLAKSVYYSWLRTFAESALDAEWADSVLRLCQRELELKHGHSLARARAFHGACQVLCTAVDADVRVDLPVEVLTSSKIFPGGDVILSLAQLYVADHSKQSSRRNIVRTYVDSLINHPRSIATLLLQRIEVVPYSVLGQQLVRGEGVTDRAGHPDTGIAFCDPADVSLVQGAGPGCAGGASGAIYDFLGIRDDNAFPQPVREVATAVGLAKHHAYPQEGGGVLHCIHTIGPNFNCRCALCLISPPSTGERAPRRFRRDDGSEHSRKGAQEELATAYANVLCEFHAAASAEGGPTELRMLPISGGVFAGPFADEIATLTMDAIGAAAVKLPPEVSAHLLTSGRLQLCIYLSDQLDAFVEAHRLATGEALQAEHLDVLRLYGGEDPRLLQISLALDRAGFDLAEKQQLDLARGVAALVHICDGSAQALGQWLCASQSAPSRSRSTEDLEEVVRERLRELVRSAERADDMGQLRASLDAMRVAGMDESGLEQARRRLERHVAASRLSVARQGSEMSELWVAMRQAEKLGLDCEGGKLRMDELTQPDKTELRPSFGAYGAAQRAELHDWLIKQANAANTAGDTTKAASLFAQASALDPRPTTTLSYVNMCLKMGEYEFAAACYERLLTEGGLSDKARAVAQRKRADADAAVAEQRHLQAVTDDELASFLANRWFSKYTGYLPNFTLSPEDKLQQVKACCGPGPPWTDRAGWRAASERMLLYLIRTQMPNLTSLDADGSALPIKQLTGADPTAAIDLSQQPLGELSATIIGNLVQGNTALERLNLEGIELNVQQLRGNAPVETVDLSKRRLGVFSTIVIGHLLAVNTSLITLNLFNNGINDHGAKAIADALTKNRSLTELNLGNQAVRGARDSVGLARSEYGIGDDGASAIADALKTNATLVRLYLNNNCIGDDGANALADALRVNTNHKLVTLNLSGNEQVCGQATAAVRAQLKASRPD